MNRLTDEKSILTTIGKAVKNVGLFKNIVLKFAAYEDTGLEPEEMLKAYNLCVENLGNFEKLLDENIKLKKYEYLEEQGLLIKLPCKVRDRVFSNHNPHSTKGDKVTQIKINRGGLHFKTWWGYFHISDIGKTVFLTKEEAEKALEVENE